MLADPGRIYAIYLPAGGNHDLDLRGHGGTFEILWYDVRTGATTGGGLINGNAWRALGAPPYASDVAVIVARRDLNLLSVNARDTRTI